MDTVDYSKFLVKDFKYWSLFVAENQGYLGRCYVWCNRTDAMDLTDAKVYEWQELRYVLRKVEIALRIMFRPDMLNYAFLGNVTHHLHGHIIPRYSRAVQFQGVTFEDKRWGKNYQTDISFVTSPEVLEEVMKKFKKILA